MPYHKICGYSDTPGININYGPVSNCKISINTFNFERKQLIFWSYQLRNSTTFYFFVLWNNIMCICFIFVLAFSKICRCDWFIRYRQTANSLSIWNQIKSFWSVLSEPWSVNQTIELWTRSPIFHDLGLIPEWKDVLAFIPSSTK